MSEEKHQAALDGIRGFAAISVVLYHIGHWLDVPLASNSKPAVDLFFLLSGYVLTLAYSRRLDSGMTVSQFVVLRLLRLMPLVVLGTIISAAYIILRIDFKHEYLSKSAVMIATLFGVLNIPYLTAPLGIGGNQVFPLNGPQFSLFFELAINVIWAAFAFLRNKWTACVLASVCFLLTAMMGDLGGDTPDTFIAGFPRVCASFLAGVAIFHLNRSAAPWRWWPAVFWVCCGVMVVTFYAPELPVALHLVWIATISPLLVMSGARTQLRGRIRSLSLLGGRLSYPIYVLHYPIFVWINGLYQTVFGSRDALIEGVLICTITIGASLIVLKFYDEPVRHKLAVWFKRSFAASRASSASWTQKSDELIRELIELAAVA